jgi:hypothetical protein
MSYQRIKGGEKNLKSGVRWTKDEIYEVYKLYKRINGVGLHEHNPEIQKLAAKLGRTVRSTEAQTLMFRNLERAGKYSHGNMNKLSREVWIENEGDISVKTDGEIEAEAKETLDYLDWNKLLVQYYFNPSLEGQEIGCFPVSEEVFEELTKHDYSIEDFFDAIRIRIGTSNFFDELSVLYQSSIPKSFMGRILRKDPPEYFGFLIFLIYALSEDDKGGITVSNVYDRINHFGGEIFKNKWKNINSVVSRNLLEPIWESLEEWSTQFKKGTLGLFILRDPKNQKRKFVSRIERHSLFNSKQFQTIIDSLISEGYQPESILSVGEWLDFFNKYDLPNAGLIKEYISDGSTLQSSVIGFLNSYLKTHFDDTTIASQQNEFRVPPIKLKVCIESLPIWPDDPIQNIFLRAYGEGLDDDKIQDITGITIDVTFSDYQFSERINYPFNLKNGVSLKGERNRYTTGKRIYWLSKNHRINEWVEVNYPSNESTFLLIIQSDLSSDFLKESEIRCSKYAIEKTDFVVLQFSSLNENDFDKVYNLYNPYKKIEGKIELVSNFTLERRTCLFKEFEPKFRYIGPTANPTIIAVDANNKEELCVLHNVEEKNGFYELSSTFAHKESFQIKEKGSLIKTRYNLRLGSLNEEPINIHLPHLKNHEGRNDITIERSDSDIFDIPSSFNRDFDVSQFNKWHRNLFSLFKPDSDVQLLRISTERDLNPTSGDRLLQFTSLSTNISTYDFPKLLRELDPEVSVRYSKRLMDYWRHLGYINFQDYGERVKVNPASLFFLQTSSGLKGLLTGYRSKEQIDRLIKECSNLKIKIQFEHHSTYKPDLFPTRIILYDLKKDLNKFKIISDVLNLSFINDIQNPYNPRYVVYQLACFYTQRSVKEFLNLKDYGPFYEDESGRTIDHRRKRIYNSKRLYWEDTTEDVEKIRDGSVVRYDGFKDKSMIHIFRSKSRSLIIDDISLPIFSNLNSDILIKKDLDEGSFDLYVPLYLGLPFWIERGLILLNGVVPDIRKVNESTYRVYEKVNVKILEVIEKKLNQKIQKI